jgi:hypothetical protein
MRIKLLETTFKIEKVVLWQLTFSVVVLYQNGFLERWFFFNLYPPPAWASADFFDILRVAGANQKYCPLKQANKTYYSNDSHYSN